jgi:hypothetical protein
MAANDDYAAYFELGFSDDSDVDDLSLVAASSQQDIETLMKQTSAIRDLPPPETPAQGTSTAPPQRFKKYDEKEIQDLYDARQSEATKKNTTWGVQVFQGKYNLKNIKNN